MIDGTMYAFQRVNLHIDKDVHVGNNCINIETTSVPSSVFQARIYKEVYAP